VRPVLRCIPVLLLAGIAAAFASRLVKLLVFAHYQSRGSEIVESLKMRRPEGVTPRAWETALTWASIAYGNVCIPDAVSIADMRLLVFDLEAKTTNDLDLSTCDWIWARLKAIVPGGSSYYAEFWPEYRRDLAYAQTNDESLPILQGFTEQRYLDLRGTLVTDAGLISLKKAGELESLSLSELTTDAGMTHLNGLRNLRWLSLMGTKVTDTGLEQLKDLPRLEKLYVVGSGVTQEGERRFQQRLPRCEFVR